MDISRPADYFIACYTVLTRRDPTKSKQLSTVAILGFQFGLYHAVAPLSFLRSISLASLFILTIFGRSDPLQILRKQAAFLFAVLCIVMLNCLAYRWMSLITGKMTCKNTGLAFGIDVMAIATLLTKEWTQLEFMSMSWTLLSLVSVTFFFSFWMLLS